MSAATTKITDAKMQILNISDNFEKFLLPQRQMICGPSMSGKIKKTLTMGERRLFLNKKIFNFFTCFSSKGGRRVASGRRQILNLF